MTALKAMFWKEGRENVRWAVLGLLALSLGLAYAWYRLPSSPALSQVWSGENLVLTLITPLIALALGLMQVLPELRRDQWAFLIHRPASRTMLFFGKVIPGVCLYLAATTLPLLGLAVWASSPNHVAAPFDFRFTLAGWAAILSGLPFYFAGLLVALRPARWYGSRALPILTALLGPWAANGLTEFWQAALVSLFVSAVLLAAAWGSFVAGGEYDEQKKSARFALGLALYPAMLAIGFAVLAGAVGAYHVLEGKTASENEWWQTDDKMDTQGRLFHLSEHGTDLAHMERKTVTVTDAAGHPVDPRLWQTLNQQKKLLDIVYLFVKPSTSNFVTRYQDPTRYVPYLGPDYDANQRDDWYYDKRSRRIVGYRVGAPSEGRIGYLGPNGFAEDPGQTGQFPEGTPYPIYFNGLRLLRFPHALFWYSTPHPTAGLLQAAPGPSGILGVTPPSDISAEYGGSGDVERPEALLVAADGQITVYARARREDPAEGTRRLFSTPLAFPVSTSVQAAIIPDQSRFFFWYRAESKLPDHIVTVASDGRVLKTETLAVSPRAAGWTAPPTSFRQGMPGLVVPPVFVAASGVYAAVGHALHDEGAESWWRGFGNGGELLWVLFFSALGGLLPALMAWFISRRLGDGKRGQIAWAFGIFLLGGYGILLLLALRAWPARVPCPNCGRQRVVDRETCEHCGAAFARPKRDGTEIFEAAERETVGR